MRIDAPTDHRLVRRLIEFAGEPGILEEALDALSRELPQPPTHPQVMGRILLLRAAKGLDVPGEDLPDFMAT